MTRRSVLALFGVLAAGCSTVPKVPPTAAPLRGTTDPALAERIGALVRGFRGDAGVYAFHMTTGQEVAVRADDLFPTASLVKVPILVAVFDRIERGQLAWRTDLFYDRSREYAGEDILASFRDGQKITLPALLMLMISMSDNTASLWAQELAGTGTVINGWLESNGFSKTRVNSRTPGREADREKLGWGQSTPREMADLLVRIKRRALISAAASERMDRILSRPYLDGDALSQIPPDVHALSKQGAVSRARAEVVLVDAPSGPYVFTVMTANQSDERFGPDNEGNELIRRVSRTLWEAFEPRRNYQAPEGSERYR